MNDFAFQYAILRYMHDPLTGEFINVGVVIHSKEARYLKLDVNPRYSRLSKTFNEINGTYYRRIVGHLQRQIAAFHQKYHSQYDLLDEMPAKLDIILNSILSPDDSSLIFGGYGSGLTSDLDKEIKRLFERFVLKYEEQKTEESRNEQQVWHAYAQELDKHNISLQLAPVTIRTQTYQYDFDHAWKNDRWHPIEPVSFDLQEEQSIRNKSDRWIGRILNLADSDEIGTLYMLTGAPRHSQLMPVYHHATKNLRDKTARTGLKVEIIEEDEAANFSERLAKLIQEHENQP